MKATPNSEGAPGPEGRAKPLCEALNVESSETRNPKPEIRKAAWPQALRDSGFGFLSDFGCRVSGFPLTDVQPGRSRLLIGGLVLLFGLVIGSSADESSSPASPSTRFDASTRFHRLY